MRKLVSGDSVSAVKAAIDRIFIYAFTDWRIEALMRREFRISDGENLVALYGVLQECQIERRDGYLECRTPSNWDVFKFLNTFRSFEHAYFEALDFKNAFLNIGLETIGISRNKGGLYIVTSVEDYFGDTYYIKDCEYSKEYHCPMDNEIFRGTFDSREEAKDFIYRMYKRDVDESVFSNALEYAMFQNGYDSKEREIVLIYEPIIDDKSDRFIVRKINKRKEGI